MKLIYFIYLFICIFIVKNAFTDNENLLIDSISIFAIQPSKSEIKWLLKISKNDSTKNNSHVQKAAFLVKIITNKILPMDSHGINISIEKIKIERFFAGGKLICFTIYKKSLLQKLLGKEIHISFRGKTFKVGKFPLNVGFDIDKINYYDIKKLPKTKDIIKFK